MDFSKVIFPFVINMYLGKDTFRICRLPISPQTFIYFFNIFNVTACHSYYCGVLTVVFYFPYSLLINWNSSFKRKLSFLPT